MTQRLRVAIAGCGAVSRHLHLPNLRRMPDVRVVALADPDSAATSFARRLAPGALVFRDWRDMLAHGELDAVLIALPTELHAPAAQAVLQARLHLYLEKPLATTTADAAPVLQAWQGSDCVAMIGFNYRFNPLYRALREIIRSGRLGALIAFRTQFTTSTVAPGWRALSATGGGVLLDLASHHIDLVRFLAGSEVRQASVQRVSRETEHDTASLVLELHSGVLVQSFFASGACDDDSVEVIGRNGRARVRRHDSTAVELLRNDAASIRSDQLKNMLQAARSLPYLLHKLRSTGHEPSYALALQRFVQAVRGDDVEYPDLEDGLRALTVAESVTNDAHDEFSAGGNLQPRVNA